jgi:exodeoxyribonuclease VII large subunit
MDRSQRTLYEEASAGHMDVYRVSQVSSLIASVLDDPRFQDIWVRGEVTNFKCHTKGHCYFSLGERDDHSVATLQCVMFRTDAQRLGFSPRDGMDVLAMGSIGHYAPQGKYQLYVKELRLAGEGEKHLMVERWKRELEAEGHFDPAKKRPLPQYPDRVGVVTSGTGAVLQDIRNVISRRYPLEIVLSPAAVQGEAAVHEITEALARVDGTVDVIIIARGGGSFEDLFPFNGPEVVRAISSCRTPVVSAIGHEVDVTLADFAADVRAPTPSAAAELVVPDRAVLIENLLANKTQIQASLLSRLERAADLLGHLRERMAPRRLERRITEKKEDLAVADDLLEKVMSARLEREHLQISSMRSSIEARNPYSILSRGYCIPRARGKIVRSVSEISRGERMELQMQDGNCDVVVEEKHEREI